MLSDQKLIDALHEYICKNGIGSLMLDRNFLPLSPIDSLPSFLLSHDEANCLKAKKKRVKSSESIADKALAAKELEGPRHFPYARMLEGRPVNDSKSREELESFLRLQLGCPGLIVKFERVIASDCSKEAIHKYFPLSLSSEETECTILLTVPKSQGDSVPESTARVILNYLHSNHYTIGSDYVTFSNIRIRAPVKKNDSYTQASPPEANPKQIAGPFLYKSGPVLGVIEKDALFKGSAYMLVSIENEIRALVTTFLCDSFIYGKFCKNGQAQRHALKLLVCLMTGGSLLYSDVKIVDFDLQHYVSIEESDKILLFATFTALVSFGTEFKGTVMEIGFSGAAEKSTERDTDLVYYSISRYYVEVGSKNAQLMKALTGSDEPYCRFIDSEKGISKALMGRNFARNFEGYHDEALAKEKKTHYNNQNCHQRPKMGTLPSRKRTPTIPKCSQQQPRLLMSQLQLLTKHQPLL